MTELDPESEEVMSYYKQEAAKYGLLADALGTPRFSSYTFDEMGKLIGTDAVFLVEAVTRLGNYRDTKNIADMRKAVSKLSKKSEAKLGRGKRTAPGLLEMVADLAPILLYFGLPLASSERSRLVVALRMIAEEVGVTGDPRDEIRRLHKIKRTTEELTKKAVFEAVARGLSSLFITPV